jgi:hypothetical protein
MHVLRHCIKIGRDLFLPHYLHFLITVILRVDGLKALQLEQRRWTCQEAVISHCTSCKLASLNSCRDAAECSRWLRDASLDQLSGGYWRRIWRISCQGQGIIHLWAVQLTIRGDNSEDRPHLVRLCYILSSSDCSHKWAVSFWFMVSWSTAWFAICWVCVISTVLHDCFKLSIFLRSA